MRMFCRSFALLVVSLLASSSFASDGVLEINQACVAEGCFPGDFPGFPVLIQNSGSYRLTSNLSFPAGGEAAIAFVNFDGSTDDTS